MLSCYVRFLYLFRQESCYHFRFKHHSGLLRKEISRWSLHTLTFDACGEPNVRCDTAASALTEFQNAGQQTLSPKDTGYNSFSNSNLNDCTEMQMWLRVSVQIQHILQELISTRIYCVTSFVRDYPTSEQCVSTMHKTQPFPCLQLLYIFTKKLKTYHFLVLRLKLGTK